MATRQHWTLGDGRFALHQVKNIHLASSGEMLIKKSNTATYEPMHWGTLTYGNHDGTHPTQVPFTVPASPAFPIPFGYSSSSPVVSYWPSFPTVVNGRGNLNPNAATGPSGFAGELSFKAPAAWPNSFVGNKQLTVIFNCIIRAPTPSAIQVNTFSFGSPGTFANCAADGTVTGLLLQGAGVAGTNQDIITLQRSSGGGPSYEVFYASLSIFTGPSYY